MGADMVDNETIWHELGTICLETLNKWAGLSFETISKETKIRLARLYQLADYDSDAYGEYDKYEVKELHALWYRVYNNTVADDSDDGWVRRIGLPEGVKYIISLPDGRVVDNY